KRPTPRRGRRSRLPQATANAAFELGKSGPKTTRKTPKMGAAARPPNSTPVSLARSAAAGLSFEAAIPGARRPAATPEPVPMSSLNDVRSHFLSYFGGNDHAVLPSAPLVPQSDPTLLFVNAGMAPF